MRASSSGKTEKIILAMIGTSASVAPIYNLLRPTGLVLEKGKKATAAMMQAMTVQKMKKWGVIWESRPKSLVFQSIIIVVFTSYRHLWETSKEKYLMA